MNTYLSFEKRRKITQSGYIVSHEGLFHPNRVMHEFDLLYVLQGSWEIYEDETIFSLNAGDLLILEPRKHHYSKKKSSEELKLMYIHFSPQKGDLRPVGSSLPIPRFLHLDFNPEIENEIKDIIKLDAVQNLKNRDLVLSAKLENLLLDLTVFADEHSSDMASTEKKHPEIQQLLTLFSENPDRFYSQEELAKLLHISSRTLSTHFKEVTGSTPHAYQVDYKLSLIHDLLKNTPYRTLHDIAVSYGFYDEFQMSKLFKNKYRLSPGECRKR